MSSLGAARVSASIGLALASMSASGPSVEDDSFGQLRESCKVVESGKDVDVCDAGFSCDELNFEASHCANL